MGGYVKSLIFANNLLKSNTVLSVVRLKESLNERSSSDENQDQQQDTPTLPSDEYSSSTQKCQSCNFDFSSREKQILHYKSDWHRYNLKQKLRNQCPVSEDVFREVIDNSEVSSISGTDESDEDLFQPTSNNIATSHYINDTTPSPFKNRSPKLHLQVNGGDSFISLHKCLITNRKESLEEYEIIERINKLVNRAITKSIIIMVSGGHFAAALFENNKATLHKTIHKYVVRAKQGTSQSSSDSRGHKAKSAGANLRRFCEASLKEEINILLKSWSKEISECDLIFVKSSPDANSILFSGKSPIFSKTDPRLSFIPFPTRRPTFSELKRVFDILFHVTQFTKTDCLSGTLVGVPRLCSPSYKNSSNKDDTNGSDTEICKRVPKPRVKLSARDKLKKGKEKGDTANQTDIMDSNCEKTFEKNVTLSENDVVHASASVSDQCSLEDKIEFDSDQTSKAEDVNTNSAMAQTVVDLYQKDTNECFQFLKSNITDIKHDAVFMDNSTCLHYFSSLNDSQFIEYLLEEGFDVTTRNYRNKTPCQLVTQKKARNVFRKFRARFPDKFDYSLSWIPEPLDEEEENARMIKNAAKKKENKQRRKEAARIEKEAHQLEKIEQKQKEEFLNLSDREKRALAVERRLALNNNDQNKNAYPILRCFQCGKCIDSLVPFKYNENSFCTTDCVAQHRKESNIRKQ